MQCLFVTPTCGCCHTEWGKRPGRVWLGTDVMRVLIRPQSGELLWEAGQKPTSWKQSSFQGKIKRREGTRADFRVSCVLYHHTLFRLIIFPRATGHIYVDWETKRAEAWKSSWKPSLTQLAANLKDKKSLSWEKKGRNFNILTHKLWLCNKRVKRMNKHLSASLLLK